METVQAKGVSSIMSLEISQLKTRIATLEDDLKTAYDVLNGDKAMTNTGWPHEKRLHEEIKELKRRLADCVCKHPGCCCVCGHTGQCPEDGPIAFGGTLE